MKRSDVVSGAPAQEARSTVVYLCSYLTEEIVRERGLPSLNAAGTNRAARLAEALDAAGCDVYMVSAATAMRQRWVGRIVHGSRARRIGRTRILFARGLGLPYLCLMFEPLALLMAVGSICRRRQPAMVIVYNYFPAILVTGLITKWLYGAKLLLDLEDVSRPRMADWVGRGDARPIQQLAGWLLLKLGSAACDCALVPTRRFLSSVRRVPSTVVVTGCIATPHTKGRSEVTKKRVRVLVAGKLDEEQGVALILEAIDALAENPRARGRLEFDLCGFAEDEEGLRSSVDEISKKGMGIRWHGRLDRKRYLELLDGADVCVAMQKPHGRHGEGKTPSKVYEYLASGKVVIASDVGDLRELPESIIRICEWRKEELTAVLLDIAENWQCWEERGQRAAAFAQREFEPRKVGQRILNAVFGSAWRQAGAVARSREECV